MVAAAGEGVILVADRRGEVERFDGPFRAFAAAMGVPHVGPLLDAGAVVCRVRRGPGSGGEDIAVHWRGEPPTGTVRALQRALLALGVEPAAPCEVGADGRTVRAELARLHLAPDLARAAAARETRPPSPMVAAAERMGAAVLDADVGGATLARVVWAPAPPEEILAHDPAVVGLACRRGAHPGVWALHVGDPGFWHVRLASDYGRCGPAWELEITAAPGDALVEDVQYALPEQDGERGDSAILLTRRRALRSGTDFRIARRMADAAPDPATWRRGPA